jgi:hypothetical protein
MAPALTRHATCLLAAWLLAAPVAADEVWLRGGGRLSGIVVEETAHSVVVEIGPGRVTLPARLVERIVHGRSPIESYRERAAGLDPRDAEGWADLARWADEREMATLATEAWRRALAADPSHPSANLALGRARVDGEWLDEDEAYRARGYVLFDGRWVTPAEHEAFVREREADSERERRASERRVREAEGRAREAEDRAREAEAAAQEAAAGIPYWWGWGAGAAWPVVDAVPPDAPATHPPPRTRPGPRPRPDEPRDTWPAPPTRTPRPKPQAGVPLPPAP